MIPRPRTVEVRLTEEEYKALHTLARNCGEGLPLFMRRTIMEALNAKKPSFSVSRAAVERYEARK